jgi:hypothetical protein
MNGKGSKFETSYFRQLIEAGWSGVVSAHQKSLGNEPSRVLFVPAAVGAAVGALSESFRGRKSGSSVAKAAILGSAVGLSVGAAWSSRDSATAAIRKINAARDLHWLEKHPVAYG